MFSLICVWINSCVNNREVGELRRYRAHYGVIVMRLARVIMILQWLRYIILKRKCIKIDPKPGLISAPSDQILSNNTFINTNLETMVLRVNKGTWGKRFYWRRVFKTYFYSICKLRSVFKTLFSVHELSNSLVYNLERSGWIYWYCLGYCGSRCPLNVQKVNYLRVSHSEIQVPPKINNKQKIVKNSNEN